LSSPRAIIKARDKCCGYLLQHLLVIEILITSV
jgi:hypothetical protein